MLCQGSQRDSWLRLAPEPERVLPPVLAALRTGEPDPTATQISTERQRLESLVLHGNANAWLTYLSEAASLATSSEHNPRVRVEALIAAEVVRDHHRLLLGISPQWAKRSAGECEAMEQLARRLLHGGRGIDSQ